MQTHVFAYALQIHYVAYAHQHGAIVCPDREKFAILHRSLLLPSLIGAAAALDKLFERHGLIDGFEKLVIAERFEQVVYRIELEAVYGKFRVGGREYHEAEPVERTYEVETVLIGHVDIDEQQIRILPVEHVARLRSAAACSHQFERRGPCYILLYLTQSQRLVVYCNAPNHDSLPVLKG